MYDNVGLPIIPKKLTCFVTSNFCLFQLKGASLELQSGG